MVKSMTGFGKASGEYKSRILNVEIKSLNSKSFDLSLKMPGLLKDKDIELRAFLNKELERGKVDFVMYFENAGASKKYFINQELALAYYNELNTLATAIKQEQTDFIGTLLKMPDVLESEQSAAEETDWPAIMAIIEKAVIEFNKFRSDEGKVLENELKMRITNILKNLAQIENMDPQRIENVKTRIYKSIAEFVEGDKIDRNRFEQELIYYIEKIDITEEKVRLKTHCDYFFSTITEDINNGKKLGFITQEIGREINTIGSKANDADVQKLVVQMKDELEKVKEQSLNVL